MISLTDIQPAGKFLKPHGVNGEISILRDNDIIDFSDCRCVVVEMDGIFVPFFINSVRPKGADTDLVTIDGISDERHAATLTNKTVYILRSDIPEESTDDSGDGFYAEDFIGFDVRISGMGLLGKISGIEDSTANYLFIIETTDGRNLLIPVADEFVTGIDTDSRSIEMDLPEGLIDIQ